MPRDVNAAMSSRNPAEWVISEDALSVEPYGILLPPDDAAFKKVADDALAAIYRNGDIDKIYAKWFLNPIAPNGVNLNVLGRRDPEEAPIAPARATLIELPALPATLERIGSVWLM